MKFNIKNLLRVISRSIFVFIVLFSLLSCGSKNNTSNVESATIESAPVLLQEMNNNAKSSAPVSIDQPNENSLIDEINETNTAIKLNPPHGEPGHRCDIAVGAPLESPAPASTIQASPNITAPVTPSINTTINSTVNTSSGRVGPTIENLKNFRPSQPINSTSTVSINPPHGQPGHRCDIPVGDPLPATTNSTVMINPPHGEPGHRCDIPVGDPLPS